LEILAVTTQAHEGIETNLMPFERVGSKRNNSSP